MLGKLETNDIFVSLFQLLNETGSTFTSCWLWLPLVLLLIQKGTGFIPRGESDAIWPLESVKPIMKWKTTMNDGTE